ncbi:MAG: PepSY-like domain-containing protein [Ginsengibacter sp.]
MKKTNKILSLAFATGIFLASCGNNTSNVPANVKANFEKDFPGVNAKWDKEDSSFEASFKQNNNTMSAMYDANGNKLETEQDIDAAAIPQNIKDYVFQNYKGKNIKEAIITKANSEVNYEAEVKENDLLFTKDGQFIKATKAD